MRLEQILRQEDFDALLALFSDDREEAGLVYEEVRSGLVRFFEAKGCRDSDMLADETLSRVAAKAQTFDRSLNKKPTAFIYGFAAKILLEYFRNPQKMRITYDRWVQSALFLPVVNEEADTQALVCLEKCLRNISVEERELIILYYSKEKQEKIELRKRLAEELGIKMETLHMRVHRLRQSLKDCMDRCLRTGK